MKTAIMDVQTLKALRPNAIVDYLQAHGWQQTGDWNNKATIWGTPRKGLVQNLLCQLHSIFRTLRGGWQKF